MSNTSYTGQAFKRRNVVRFRHKGPKEDLPSRRFIVRDLLCGQMGFLPSSILAVINLPDWQGYDVSFKLMPDLDRFWSNFTRFRDKEGWDKFSFVPISKPDTVNLTIMFWNEAVPYQDIVVWLKRHCDLVSDLTKTRDEDGVWTGGWKVLVKLRQQENVTHHLPNSFIGREKGVCFYPGQPRKCFRCGRSGHIANVCSVVKCNLCGEEGHVSAACQKIRCNLCGEIGHAHRDCPNAWHNICRDSPDEGLLEGADAHEDLEEVALVTQPEPQPDTGNQPDQPRAVVIEGSMEVAEQDVQQPGSTSTPGPASNVREGQTTISKRKKSKSTRKPEEEWTVVQRSGGKKKNKGEGTMVLSNRFSVLSEEEAEAELERELKQMMEEYDGDPENESRKKRRPHQSDSDMETGGREDGSDSDL